MFRVWGKKEREEIRGKRYGAFPSLFLSLSLSLFRVHGTNKFRAKRATTKNDTTRHYVCSTKHEFYRRESCRGEIRQDDATVRLLLRRVVFGARIPVFLVCVHFCALNWSLSLSDGMMVRISSRPEKARARASFFPAFRRRRVRERSRRVGGGSSRSHGLFLRRRLADIIRSNRSLSLSLFSTSLFPKTDRFLKSPRNMATNPSTSTSATSNPRRVPGTCTASSPRRDTRTNRLSSSKTRRKV